MRTVALAALAILTAAPESLLEPSFEMSFAAVFGLVALYEWLAARKRWSLSDVSPLWRSLRWSAALVFGAAITTIVASAAVAPLVSVLIMPMVLLALIAMPFGLEALLLHATGYGMGLMVRTAQSIWGWPGAVTIVRDIFGTALVLIVLGGCGFVYGKPACAHLVLCLSPQVLCSRRRVSAPTC